MNKPNTIYTYDGIFFSLIQKKIQSDATTWINLEEIMLSEIRQSQVEKMLNDSTYIMYLR